MSRLAKTVAETVALPLLAGTRGAVLADERSPSGYPILHVAKNRHLLVIDGRSATIAWVDKQQGSFHAVFGRPAKVKIMTQADKVHIFLTETRRYPTHRLWLETEFNSPDWVARWGKNGMPLYNMVFERYEEPAGIFLYRLPLTSAPQALMAWIKNLRG
ncbi:MAG: hypothetical protein ACOZAO_00165 [Patescibacteria group bacterium]